MSIQKSRAGLPTATPRRVHSLIFTSLEGWLGGQRNVRYSHIIHLTSLAVNLVSTLPGILIGGRVEFIESLN